MENIISLKKFGSNLNTRAFADSIFMVQPEDSDVVVDFIDINSATPSFCHEMLLVLKKRKINAKIVNTNESIKLQIQKAIGSMA